MIPPKNNKVVDVSSLIDNSDGEIDVSTLIEKKNSGEDLYSGQRPSSYPLKKQDYPLKPIELNSNPQSSSQNENEVFFDKNQNGYQVKNGRKVPIPNNKKPDNSVFPTTDNPLAFQEKPLTVDTFDGTPLSISPSDQSPYAASLRQNPVALDGLRQRVASGNINDNDVSVLSTGTGKSPQSVKAYVSGGQQKGALVDLYENNEKQKNDLLENIGGLANKTGVDSNGVMDDPDKASSFLQKTKDAITNADTGLWSYVKGVIPFVKSGANLISDVVGGDTAGIVSDVQDLKQASQPKSLQEETKDNIEKVVPLLTNRITEQTAQQVANGEISPQNGVDVLFKRLDPVEYIRVSNFAKKPPIKTNSPINSVFAMTNAVSSDADDERKKENILNAQKAEYELRLNQGMSELATKLTAEGIATGNYALVEKAKTITPYIKDNQEIINKSPILLSQQMAQYLNGRAAKESGLYGGEPESMEGVVIKTSGINSDIAKKWLNEGGFYSNPIYKGLVDDVAEHTNSYLSDNSKFGSIGMAFLNPAIGVIKGTADLMGASSAKDRYTEALKDQMFPAINPNQAPDFKVNVFGKEFTGTWGQTFNSVASLGGYMAMGAGVGMAAKGIGFADAAVARLTAFSTFGLDAVHPAITEAEKLGLNTPETALYTALKVGLMTEGGRILEAPFQKQISSVVIPGMSDDIAKVAMGLSNNTMTKEAGAKILDNAFLKYVDAAKKYGLTNGKKLADYAGNTAKGAGVMSAFGVGDKLIKIGFGDPNAKMEDILPEAAHAYFDGLLTMGILGSFGLAKDMTKNSSFKAGLMNVIDNHDAAQDVLTSNKQRGFLTQDQYNERMAVINTGIKAKATFNEAVKKTGIDLDNNQRATWVANATAEKVLREQASQKGVTEADAKKFNEQADNLVEQNSQIFNGLKFSKSLEPQYELFNAQNELKDAQDKLIESDTPENQKLVADKKEAFDKLNENFNNGIYESQTNEAVKTEAEVPITKETASATNEGTDKVVGAAKVSEEDKGFIKEAFDNNLLPSIDKGALTTDGKFDESKVEPYLKEIAMQVHGVDANGNERTDGNGEAALLKNGYPKDIIQIAKEAYPKESLLQQPELKPQGKGRFAALAKPKVEPEVEPEVAPEKVAETAPKEPIETIPSKSNEVEGNSALRDVESKINDVADEYLFHGTGEGAFRRIRVEGMKSKSGGYLYFADTEQYAKTYAQRKGNSFGDRVLRVKKSDAYEGDVNTGLKGDFKIKSDIKPEDIEINDRGKWIPIQEYSNENIGILPLSKPNTNETKPTTGTKEAIQPETPKPKGQENKSNVPTSADEAGRTGAERETAVLGNRERKVDTIDEFKNIKNEDIHSVRDLANLDAKEQSGLLSGAVFSSLRKGDIINVGGKKYTVETKTKATENSYFKKDGKRVDYKKSSIKLRGEDGKAITGEFWEYKNGSGNWLGRGSSRKSDKWGQLSRDMEGDITRDLINENNKFHEPSDSFNKAQSFIDDYNNKIKNENKPIKISKDAAENELITPKLTEKDSPVQEPSIKAIESKGKNAENSKSEKLAQKVISEIDAKINSATDVHNVKVADLKTDEASFQNRSEGLNEGKVKDIVENYNPSEFDPITYWTDKDGNKITLNHHRFEAAKQLGLKEIPARELTYPKGHEKAGEIVPPTDKAEAIDFAINRSNANRSMEASIDRAKALRKLIDSGASKEEINKFLDREGKNKTFVQNVAALNPNGKTIGTLAKFGDAEDRKTQKETEQRVDWIGEARRTINGLTDAHENEMFNFLFDKDASKRVTAKADFLQKVRSSIKPLTPDEPLNIARFKNKTQGEVAYDEDVAKAKSALEEKQSQINALNDRFSNPENKDYIPTDSPDYESARKIADTKISNLDAERKILQKKLEDIYRNKGKYTGTAATGSLFQVENKSTNEELNTAKQIIKEMQDEAAAEDKKITLKDIQDEAAKDGVDPDLIEEAYHAQGKESPIAEKDSIGKNIDNEVTTLLAKRINGFVDKIFGKAKNSQHAVVLKDSDALKEQANELGGVKFQITGEKALHTQDVKDNLSVAREMEKKGKSSKDIYLATGWERGNDGKWNYEIPDLKFKDNTGVENEINLVLNNKKDHYATTLSEIASGSELLSRYPQLRESTVQFVNEPKNSYKGEYEREGIKTDGTMGAIISINTARLDEAVVQYGLDKKGGSPDSQRRLAVHSILAHELQHAVQDIEGFAKGGNEFIARKIIYDKVENEIKNIPAYKSLLNKEQELRSQGKIWGDPAFEKVQDQIADFKNKYAAMMTKSGTLKESEYDSYKSLTGETQARNAQKRLRLTDEQKKKTPISETEDISRKDQINYFGKDGVQKDIQFQKAPDGTILGFTDPSTGKIYLNGEKLNANTPVHEASHLFLGWAKENEPQLHQRGLDLTENSRYLKEVKANKVYQDEAAKLPKNEQEDYYREEALAAAIGDKGAQFVSESRRKSFADWAKELWNKVAEAVGFKDVTAKELQNMTLDEFSKRAATDILKGEPQKLKAEESGGGKDGEITNKELLEVKPEPTSLSYAGTKELEQEFGIDERQPTIRKSDAETIKQADDLLNSGWDVKTVMDKMENEHFTPNDAEYINLTRYGAELSDRLRALKDSPLSAEYTKTFDELNRLVQLSNEYHGREQARGLSIRGRYKTVPDGSYADYMITERQTNNDAPLSEKQVKIANEQFTDYENKMKQYEEDRTKFDEEVSKFRAEQKLKEIKPTKSKTNKTHEDFVKDRKSIIEAAKEKIRLAREKANDPNVQKMGIGGRTKADDLITIAPEVLKIARSYVDEAAMKLSEIVKKLHDDFSGVVNDLSEKDINDILAGEYSQRKITKKEAAIRLENLRIEAQLLNKLDRVLSGTQPKNEKAKIKRTQEIEDLRKQIQEVSKQSLEANKFHGEEVDEGVKKLNSLIKKNENETAKIKENIAKGNYEPEEKRTPLMSDSEMRKRFPETFKKAQESRDALIKAKRDIAIRRMKQMYENRTPQQKFADVASKSLNIPRTLMASMDFSAPLRQGIVASIAHPIIAKGALKFMFEAAANEKVYNRWLDDVHNSRRFDIAEKTNLSISDPDSLHAKEREEAFQGAPYIERVPLLGGSLKLGKEGVKIPFTNKKIKEVGGFVSGSERAYVGYLNKLRWDIFNMYADRFESMGKTYENNPKLYEGLSSMINSSTGRGNMIKGLQGASPLLNTVLFASRLLASRMNMLGITDVPNLLVRGLTLGKVGVDFGYYSKLPKELRVESMKDMVKFVGVGLATLFLVRAIIGGSEDDDKSIETDPRSSDFGKIRVGDTRWDIWGGFQPYARVLTQVLMGQRKATTTGQIYDLNGKGFMGQNRATPLLNFARGKLAPVPSSIYNYISGTNMVGEPSTLVGETTGWLTPLMLSDLHDAMKDSGVKAIFTVGIPSTLGVGVQTFKAKTKPSLFTKADEKVPEIKWFVDRDVQLPSVDVDRQVLNFKDKKGVDREVKISDYSEDIQDKYTKAKTEKLKQGLSDLFPDRYVYIRTKSDADGKEISSVTIAKPDGHYELKQVKELSKDELKQLVSIKNSQATKDAKKEVFYDNDENLNSILTNKK